MMTPRNLCIYHGNCADGFGAAWVTARFSGKPFEFHAGKYQNEPPWELIDGSNVYLVDFSYKFDVMLKILARAHHVTLIDHHKSAITDLEPLFGDTKLTHNCDLDHSGAVLAWKFWMGSAPMPDLIAHIEDRDLWRFKLPQTREIQAAVFSYPYDLEVWDQLMNRPVETLAKEGEAINRKHLKDVRELVEGFSYARHMNGFLVPWLNCPYFHSSEAGNIMAQGVPFAVCYYDGADGRNFSLRSTDAGMDVSHVAVCYGGGGHRNAAGFRVPYDHPLAQPGV